MSLLFALITVAIALVFGTLIGVAAGYVGGWVDVVVMRIVDIQLALPRSCSPSW